MVIKTKDILEPAVLMDILLFIASVIVLTYCVEIRITTGESIGTFLTYTSLVSFAVLVITISNLRKLIKFK